MVLLKLVKKFHLKMLQIILRVCVHVYICRGDKVVAVASLAFDPIVSQAASLMEKGDTILKSEIQ